MTEATHPRTTINLNGELFPASEARVSAMDHGFLYGDSVYETLRTYRRVPFLLGPHLDRLERSAERIFLALPVPRPELEREVLRTIDLAPGSEEVWLRIVVSRGPGALGLDPALCERAIYLIYVTELQETPVLRHAQPDSSGEGVSVVISRVRRNSPEALDPSIKSGNFLNNILAYKEARDAGAHEALLCTGEGYVAEGTTSNVFAVKDGRLWTPRAGGILAGITRAVVLEEARAAGLAAGETDLPPAALLAADEVFITSSVRGIVPVVRVNERTIAAGRRGPITRRLQELYHERMERECAPRRAPAGR